MPRDDFLRLETKMLKGKLFCCTTEERLGVGKAFQSFAKSKREEKQAQILEYSSKMLT